MAIPTEPASHVETTLVSIASNHILRGRERGRGGEGEREEEREGGIRERECVHKFIRLVSRGFYDGVHRKLTGG